MSLLTRSHFLAHSLLSFEEMARVQREIRAAYAPCAQDGGLVMPLAFLHIVAKVARLSTTKRQIVHINGEGGFGSGHGSGSAATCDIESGSGCGVDCVSCSGSAESGSQSVLSVMEMVFIVGIQCSAAKAVDVRLYLCGRVHWTGEPKN